MPPGFVCDYLSEGATAMGEKAARKNDAGERETDDADRSSEQTQVEEPTDDRSEASSGGVGPSGRSGQVRESSPGEPRSERTGGSDGDRGRHVDYERGPDPRRLSERYGMNVRKTEAEKLQRLESEFGRERVGRWVAEGMPVETMGKPRGMEGFRTRQAERSEEIPTDIERRNEASLQRNAARNRDDGPAGEAGVPDVVRRVVSSPGRSMDQTVQREMESEMGGDFGDVRIHTGPRAAAAADAIDARAFTVGSHVAFNEGEYEPDTDDGKQVLAHEMTHVQQQRTGSVDRRPNEGSTLAIDPDPTLEREAEDTAREVLGNPESSGPLRSDSRGQAIQRQPKTGAQGESPGRGASDVTPADVRKMVVSVLRANGLQPPEGASLEDYVTVDTTYSERSEDWNTSVNVYLGPNNQPVPKYEHDEEMAKKQVAMGSETTVMDVVAAGGERVPASKRLEFEIHKFPDGTHDVATRVVDARSAKVQKMAYSEGTRRGGPQLESVISTGLDDIGIDIDQPMSKREPADKSGPSETGGTDGSSGDGNGSGGSPEGEKGPTETSSGDGEGGGGSPQGKQATPEKPSGEGGGSGGSPQGEQASTAYEEYEITEGDTLWDLAREYDVKGGWRALWNFKDNRDVIGEDPHLIYPGDVIKIPT